MHRRSTRLRLSPFGRSGIWSEFLLPLKEPFGDPVAPITGDAFLLPRSIVTRKGTDSLILRYSFLSLLLAFARFTHPCLHLLIGYILCRFFCSKSHAVRRFRSRSCGPTHSPGYSRGPFSYPPHLILWRNVYSQHFLRRYLELSLDNRWSL
jgi:hypothetical protein